MAMTFAEQQEAALRRIIKANGRSSLYAHLGLQKLGSYRDFELLYQSFSRAVPVQSPKGWLESLSRILQPPGQAFGQVLGSPGLLTRGRIDRAVPHKGVPLPWGNDLADDVLDCEAHMKSRLQAQGMELTGAFFYLTDIDAAPREPGVPQAGLNLLLDAQRSWWRKRWVLPRAETLSAAGGSRFAWFAALLDHLRLMGGEVSVLVTTPKMLIDFMLYVSQQEGRFTPLAKLVPNLQAILFNHYEVALQRTEIGYLLQGLERVKWLQYIWQPTGFVACQYDINIRQRLEMLGNGQVFYEFVPAADVTPDGRLVRNFRRLHAGQIEPGMEYMPVMTSRCGLLGVASGQIIKVLQTDPLHIAVRGPAQRLHGLGEGIREDGLVEALANINMALSTQGVFVRDALLGHRVAERQPVWVLEVSRPMAEVQKPVLETIARRLNGEMELRFETYRRVFRQADTKPPKVYLVPLGSFAAAQTGAGEGGLFDHSDDAAAVRKVIKAAWEHVLVAAD